MQRDAKLVSYDVVEKNTKPYVQVEIGDEKKVRPPAFHMRRRTLQLVNARCSAMHARFKVCRLYERRCGDRIVAR